MSTYSDLEWQHRHRLRATKVQRQVCLPDLTPGPDNGSRASRAASKPSVNAREVPLRRHSPYAPRTSSRCRFASNFAPSFWPTSLMAKGHHWEGNLPPPQENLLRVARRVWAG